MNLYKNDFESLVHQKNCTMYTSLNLCSRSLTSYVTAILFQISSLKASCIRIRLIIFILIQILTFIELNLSLSVSEFLSSSLSNIPEEIVSAGADDVDSAPSGQQGDNNNYESNNRFQELFVCNNIEFINESSCEEESLFCFNAGNRT